MLQVPHLWTEAMPDNVYLFSLSGAIGVGKSTLIRLLKETNLLSRHLSKVEVVIVEEPVALWRKHGWLKKFYEDPKRYALSFQFIVFCTHVQAVQEALRPYRDKAKDTVVVCLVERSMWDQLLFWKLQVDLYDAEPLMEDDSYMMVWRMFLQFLPPVSHIFYCRTDTLDQTLERIWMRGRREELGVSKSASLGTMPSDWTRVHGLDYDYHAALRAKHEAWYKDGFSMEDQCIPVTCISLNVPFHKDNQVLESIVSLIAEKIVFYFKVGEE